MDFRRIGWIKIALAVGLAIGGSLTAGAQGRRGSSGTLHTRSGRQRSEGRALQLDVEHGHAEGP